MQSAVRPAPAPCRSQAAGTACRGSPPPWPQRRPARHPPAVGRASRGSRCRRSGKRSCRLRGTAATGSQAQPWAETSRQPCHGRPSAAANNCTLETPGQHRVRQTRVVQCAAERRRAGVEARVAAENHRGLRAICLPQQCANFVRFIEGRAVCRAALGQVFQQAARADDQLRSAQRLQPLPLSGCRALRCPCPPM